MNENQLSQGQCRDMRVLLEAMLSNDASDLYVSVNAPPLIRVDGTTQPIGDGLLSPEVTEALAYSIMSEEEKLSFVSTRELNFAIADESLGRFRVNVHWQRGTVGMVIRQIKTKIPTLDDLCLPSTLKDIIMARRGLVLVTGATGSGKSTSLAAMIDHRNQETRGHIITVEDPIEFVHPNKRCVVTQREVGSDTLSFNDALKSALRQAPDVILIGEIRDVSTMEAAITFAETGHLCLGTLHSNNANQTVQRIINFFPADRHAELYDQLSLNLRAVISQRLVKGVSGKRVAALEILIDTPWAKDLIRAGGIEKLKEAMERGKSEGCQTFDDALFMLVDQGRISGEEAVANADSANNLRIRIRDASLRKAA